MARTAKKPSVDIFASAGVVESKKPASGKKKRPTFKINGLRRYAAIKTVVDMLTSELQSLKTDLDEQTLDYMARNGSATHTVPSSFDGLDDDASASMQMQKKSSQYSLNAASVELLINNGITLQTIWDVHETFIINPKYANDQKIRDRLNVLLSEDGIPSDLILKQEGVSRTVTSDDTLADIFTTKDEDGRYLDTEQLKTLLSAASTLVVKPKFNGDLKDAMDMIEEVIIPSSKVEAEVVTIIKEQLEASIAKES